MKKNKIINMILLILFLIVLNINGVSAEECVQCNDSLPIPLKVPVFVSKLVLLAKVLVPILIIVLGMVRLSMAVASGEDKVINEKKSSFIRSLIAGVSVFLIFSITQMVFSLVQQADPEKTNYFSCVSCFINGENNCKKVACIERPSIEPTN